MSTTPSHRSVAAAVTVAAVTVAALAVAACGSTSPGSHPAGGAPTQTQLERAQQAAVRFARCMRAHGVPNLPDPTSPQEFKASVAGKQQLPAFHSAATVCRRLLPGGGPPSQDAASTHTQVVAGLAFARCLRHHGFSRFPDPTSSGELTHEMLANAGIDIHQPAVVRAADACVRVTHGLITRAGVARFVAGG
jgi:hypothetical protein